MSPHRTRFLSSRTPPKTRIGRLETSESDMKVVMQSVSSFSPAVMIIPLFLTTPCSVCERLLRVRQFAGLRCPDREQILTRPVAGVVMKL